MRSDGNAFKRNSERLPAEFAGFLQRLDSILMCSKPSSNAERNNRVNSMSSAVKESCGVVVCVHVEGLSGELKRHREIRVILILHTVGSCVTVWTVL